MKSKQEIKQLIAEGRTDSAIKELLKITKDSYLHNEVIQQSCKYVQYEEVRRSGVVSGENTDIALSRINNALLSIIDKLAESLIVKNTESPTSTSGDNEKSRNSKMWKFITAAAVIIGILGSFAEIFNFINIFPSKGSDNATDSVTILVHGKEGKDHTVLPNRGVVYLIYGDAKIPEQVNNEGEATFKQINESFFAPDARVELLFEDPEGEPYRVINRDSLYKLNKKESIYLEVMLEGMDEIRGIVKDFGSGDGLDSVIVRVFGQETYSNKYGEFTLKIPEKQQNQFVTVRAYKEGYRNWELSNIPTTTKNEIVIPMKKE